MFRTLLIIILFAGFASCEKELDIQPKDAGEVLTVDGSIEEGQAPRIILTRSFKYFNTLSISDLNNAFITGAKVILSDGSTSQQLREYAIPFGTGNIIFYSTDTALGSSQLFGKLNTAYSLSIETDGKTYTANTTIPNLARTLDSIWWKPAPANKDTNKVVMFSRLTDPKGLGNYIRYFTSRNDSAFLPGLTSVFDDGIIDGTTYDIQVDRGVNRNEKLDLEEYGYFLKGDTVSIKLSNIDKSTFDFWRTWEQNQSNLGNPFSVPVKVLGNISNGGLGYFGGYASIIKRLIIPK
jgi:hypothetical protein